MASLAVTTIDRREEYEARLADALRRITDDELREVERRTLYGRTRRGQVLLKRLVRHFRARDALRRNPPARLVHNPDDYLEKRA